MSEVLLQTQSLSISFGGLAALCNFNMELSKGDLTGIIGPNGAGKTTAFNVITGHYRPDGGDILLVGESIAGLSPAAITRRGIARTFQNIRLFPDLSVLDNIRIAIHSRTNYGIWANLWQTKKCRKEEAAIVEQSQELLKIFKLGDCANQLSKNLPYGDQRRLEIARALATRPKVLLLDEPAAGMNPQETAQLTELILWIREKFAVAILLIEHDMGLVMKICRNIFVLNYGELIAEGNPEKVRSNKAVVEAYLGKDDG